MRNSNPLRLVTCAAAILFMTALPAAAAGPTADWDLPKQQGEILRSLGGVAKHFGPEAVMMQAYLLNEASRNGTILESTVHKPELLDHNGHKHLFFALDSGIVFNDNEVTQSARVLRVWQAIVLHSIQRFDKLPFAADGLAFDIRYHHRRYADEQDLRDRIPTEGRGTPEAADFFFLLRDLRDLIQHQLTEQQLLARSEVLVDGRPYVLQVPLVPATPTPPPLIPEDTGWTTHWWDKWFNL